MSLAPVLKISGIILIGIVIILLLSLFELFTQLGRYDSYWKKNNQKPATANEILYVALGDSTAQGIGATSPQKGYVSIVAKELAQKRDKPVRTVNLSKSGDKLIDILNRQLPEMEKMGIDDQTVITLSIGANDMAGFNASNFEMQIDELMGRLPKQTLIADLPYFGDGRHKKREVDVEVANKIIYRLAEKHQFKIVPLHDKIKQNGGIKSLAVDLFHPSNKSYRDNWARIFLERL